MKEFLNNNRNRLTVGLILGAGALGIAGCGEDRAQGDITLDANGVSEFRVAHQVMSVRLSATLQT